MVSALGTLVATLVDSDDLIRRGKDSPKTGDATNTNKKKCDDTAPQYLIKFM